MEFLLAFLSEPTLITNILQNGTEEIALALFAWHLYRKNKKEVAAMQYVTEPQLDAKLDARDEKMYNALKAHDTQNTNDFGKMNDKISGIHDDVARVETTLKENQKEYREDMRHLTEKIDKIGSKT